MGSDFKRQAPHPPAARRRRISKILTRIALTLAVTLPAVCAAADRFTPIIEQAGESTVTKGGFVVNQKRVAVQSELSKRPPAPAEHALLFLGAAPDGAEFIDGLFGDSISAFRIWRRP